MALTPLPVPRITAPNWGQQLNNAITSRYLDLLSRITSVIASITGISSKVDPFIPSGVMEGRAFFQYGPSRSVGVTAQRIHYNRIRERINSGFYFNAGVGGFGAADTATYATGAISQTAQRGGVNEWAPSAGVATWAAKANQGGVVLTWPFGNDARLDGWSGHNSTEAKARAAAVNGLHTFIALARTEFRLESVLQASYTRTNGSPNITGNVASPWAQGMLVQGTGIPVNTYVGDMISGGLGGFKLSSSRTTQVDVNATASGTSVLTFSPVYNSAVTWATQTNTGFSGGNAVRTLTNADTTTWVLHLPEDRRVHWVTTAVDDAEYVVAGAPFGGTGGAGYSIVIDGGTPITGTTSNQHRYGQLALSFAPMAVDLGTLAAGVHTIVVSATSANLLTDDSMWIESLTPPTVVVVKEVELPDDYYTLNAATGASYAKTLIYNGFIEDELDEWPADDSVIVLDPQNDFGYNLNLHVSDADGAYAHFNDAGERVMADGIMEALNALPSREGLVWF